MASNTASAVTVTDVTPDDDGGKSGWDAPSSSVEVPEVKEELDRPEPADQRLAPREDEELDALIHQYSSEVNLTEHERAMLRSHVVFIDPKLKKPEDARKAKMRWECWRVLTNSVPHHRHLIEREGDAHALVEVVCKRTHYTILLPS